MTDFSKMVFEEKQVAPGLREIRILAPTHPTVQMDDVRRTGNEARKRLVRYILANAATFAPQLAKELEATAARIHAEIDLETEDGRTYE